MVGEDSCLCHRLRLTDRLNTGDQNLSYGNVLSGTHNNNTKHAKEKKKTCRLLLNGKISRRKTKTTSFGD